MHLQAIRYLQSLYELPESYSVGIVFHVYKEESRKNFTGCFLLQIFSFVRVPMSKTEIVLVKARKLMPIRGVARLLTQGFPLKNQRRGSAGKF